MDWGRFLLAFCAGFLRVLIFIKPGNRAASDGALPEVLRDGRVSSASKDRGDLLPGQVSTGTDLREQLRLRHRRFQSSCFLPTLPPSVCRNGFHDDQKRGRPASRSVDRRKRSATRISVRRSIHEIGEENENVGRDPDPDQSTRSEPYERITRCFRHQVLVKRA